MFIAALLLTVKNWYNLGEQINKQRYMIKCNLAIKRSNFLDTCNSMDEPQHGYVRWKKSGHPAPPKSCAVWSRWYNPLEIQTIYSARKQSGALGGVLARRGLTKGLAHTSVGDGYVHCLDCGTVSWVFTYVKSHQVTHHVCTVCCVSVTPQEIC